MNRRTKIVATLGPATDKPGVLDELVKAGVNTVRLNFSHGDPEDHIARASEVRALAAKYDRHVAVLGDLQGPKIRTERFKEGFVNLSPGDKFILDANLDKKDGNQERVGITYKTLVKDVSPGDRLLLDDGRIVFDVKSVENQEIHCVTVNGGKLSNNKGINKQGGGLSAPAITDKDKADILTAAKIGVDYLAVSFPRDGTDMDYARGLAADAGLNAQLVAKVERAEAIANMNEVIEASDVIMVARGDLGVEIGDALLPATQKKLIKRARKHNKVVITATQMMESMIENPIPTRAEVFDVANAVLDGTDAVMLSGETAAGRYPVETVKVMGEICVEAEKDPKARKSNHRVELQFTRVDETIAMSAMYAANHAPITAIISMSESGSTPRLMSRISSSLPIYCVSQHEKTCNKVSLYKGVKPIRAKIEAPTQREINIKAIALLEQRDLVKDGDLVLITKGDIIGRQDGGTNAIKICEVGNLEELD